MLTFKQLIQQQPQVAQVLTNELIQQHISHAYLFSGNNIDEQLACAKLLIKSLVCLSPEGIEPCLTCTNCQKIENNYYRDLHILQTDQLMLKKSDSIELQQFMMTSPVEGNYKFYIILEADKLNTQAANSLLKSIEEPSSQSVGILITTSPQKLLPTILSRCQQLIFLATSNISSYQQLVAEFPKITDDVLQMAILLSKDLVQARFILSQENFSKQVGLLKVLTEQLLFDPLCILAIVDVLPEFKSKKEQIFMYRILLIFYQDMLYYKLDKQRILSYAMKPAIKSVSLAKIVSIIEQVLLALTEIEHNVNGQLVMEKLIIKVQGDKI